ncbi:chorismate lyase [Thiomonas sp.]|jgi:chorismate--pyruvate lyase|uniref:chorismate--pyruvate lyase family protein n=1 Tax=Thiomonas sp. TaxID=2047785 RepID=UPI002618931A|nr:chorismate lyase [Thiomonas sp.]
MPGVVATSRRGAAGLTQGRARACARWRELPGAAACAPRVLLPFLLERGSLSQLLRAHGREFRVLRLGQGLHAGPAGVLWTREVLLLVDGVPVVWARSVLPADALRGAWRALRGFGTRALGDWLFQRGDVRRGPLELRRLGSADPAARAVARALARTGFRAEAAGTGALWARRSAFVRRGSDLALTEVFLPPAKRLRRGA